MVYMSCHVDFHYLCDLIVPLMISLFYHETSCIFTCHPGVKGNQVFVPKTNKNDSIFSYSLFVILAVRAATKGGGAGKVWVDQDLGKH